MTARQAGINVQALQQFCKRNIHKDACLTLSQERDGGFLVLHEWSPEELKAAREDASCDLASQIIGEVRELAEIEGEAVKCWVRFMSPAGKVYFGHPMRAAPSEQKPVESADKQHARLLDAFLRQNGQMVQMAQQVSQIAIGLAQAESNRSARNEERHERELDQALAAAAVPGGKGAHYSPEEAAARAELTKSFASAVGPVLEGLGGALADAIEKNFIPPSH